MGVATHIYSAGPPLPEAAAGLEALVRQFEVEPLRTRRAMERLLEADRTAFAEAAAAVFAKDPESQGARHLLRLVAEHSLLPEVDCSPALNREQALELARMACAAFPNADIMLARGLTEYADLSEEPLYLARATHLLEVLAEISDVSRIFPALVRLLRHPDPHLRSKAVLAIGRGRRSAQWVRQRLGDADPRIRANALESLWNVDTAEARDLLLSLVHDSSNRVAGNAILGLYRLGDVAAIPGILQLARHESGLFRSTAAWVVGETEDPRFGEVLLELLRDSNATVRRRAFWALGRLREAIAQAPQACPCSLAGRLQPGGVVQEAGRPTRRLLLAVTGRDGWAAPAFLPTQLVLSEDAKMVSHYRVTQMPLAETLSVVFLLPVASAREVREAALACLPWKRPSDLWACDFYEPDAAQEAGAGDGPPHFHVNPDLIQREFARVPLRFQPRDLWRAIRYCVDPESGSAPQCQQILVIAPPETRGKASDELVAAVSASRAFVQVLAPRPDPMLASFCDRVGGLLVPSGPDLHAAILHAYLRQLVRYEVVYETANPGARALKLRLHGRAFRGEGEVALA